MSAKCWVFLMVVLVAAGCAVQAQDRIKMCGRELIRLAVSSCGNSRLKRSIKDAEPIQQHQHVPHWDQDASTDDWTTEATQTLMESDVEMSVLTVAPHWYPLSHRIKRAAGKISDICCERGCSMKELIQFC